MDTPGDPTGLEAVFLANRDTLLRFLAAHGARDAAEDLLHELWIRVRAPRGGPIAAPLAYLYRAANNLMLDRHRALRQAAKRDADWSDIAGGDVPGQSDAPPAERVLIAREQARLADQALEAIGPRAATILRRHRIDGVAQRVIAAEMGISLSTVESDLRRGYRAMIALKGRLDEV